MAPGITFRVHDVAPRREPLPPVDPRRVRVRQHGPELLAQSEKEPSAIIPFPCRHPLVGAVYLAYSRHYPLVLSPDAVWITLAQGLARHIKLNAESMRSDLVRHQGKKDLVVGTLHEGTQDPDFWPGVVENLTAQIRQHAAPELTDLILLTRADGRVEHLEIIAGLNGVTQDAETFAVRPRIGWRVYGEPSIAKHMRLTGHELRPPRPDAEIWERLLDRVGDQDGFESLYQITDGVDLHVRDGRATYRIRPLAELETISIVRLDLLRELEASIAHMRATTFADYDVSAATRRSKTTQQWTRFCDLPDGSFLAVRDDAPEIAHLTEAMCVAPTEPPRIVARSLFEALERALAGGPTPWFEGRE
ncbi:DUF4419 domain-containing protein [Polyangium sp. 15x6]|uniref:DUF4419 domain-containing protein n=1 Tax=Polyangium sp. 15x6 TaxID=3042687 RepID=UPI002499BB35|nr:DUF4419 domain-containing protein [Polyangium sp. 15x6]MDI3291532.1 DUF4419 domain-containing protein [Polyangium sp. 15x6]